MSRLPRASRRMLMLMLMLGLVAAAAFAAAPAGAQGVTPGAAPPAQAPSKGDVIPAFETLGIDGKPAKVDFARGSKTVLLFFLSSCPHCHRMIPEWNAAYERRPKDVRILGVIMDQEPPGFWSTLPVSFPVLRSPGNQFLRSLNVNRAPLTLRVGEGGRIEGVGLGEVCSAGSPAGTCVDAITLNQLFAPAK